MLSHVSLFGLRGRALAQCPNTPRIKFYRAHHGDSCIFLVRVQDLGAPYESKTVPINLVLTCSEEGESEEVSRPDGSMEVLGCVCVCVVGKRHLGQ